MRLGRDQNTGFGTFLADRILAREVLGTCRMGDLLDRLIEQVNVGLLVIVGYGISLGELCGIADYNAKRASSTPGDTWTFSAIAVNKSLPWELPAISIFQPAVSESQSGTTQILGEAGPGPEQHDRQNRRAGRGDKRPQRQAKPKWTLKKVMARDGQRASQRTPRSRSEAVIPPTLNSRPKAKTFQAGLPPS